MSDSKKAPIDLVPLRALIGAARVFEFGNTKKKPEHAQRQPGDFIERTLDGVFYASTMRHAMELQRLQGGVSAESLGAIDVESGLPTIDHLICNLLIIRTMAIRDGILPEDPKCEQHSQVAAKRKWAAGAKINEDLATSKLVIGHDPGSHVGDAVAYAWQASDGRIVQLTTDHWSTMSAELEPAPLPAPPTVEAGSGPVSCGIVDCGACRFADENDTTNKYNTPGTVRAEGVRW